MFDQTVFDIQRLYPQIYLACHVDHVRASSTSARLSSHDSSILSHLDLDKGMAPRQLAGHLQVASSTLSAVLERLSRLGYIENTANAADKRKRELRLTEKGAKAMAESSVLDTVKLQSVLKKLSVDEQRAVVKGLELFARAARELSEDKQ